LAVLARRHDATLIIGDASILPELLYFPALEQVDAACRMKFSPPLSQLGLARWWRITPAQIAPAVPAQQTHLRNFP
jgi:hypothetical protein